MRKDILGRIGLAAAAVVLAAGINACNSDDDGTPPVTHELVATWISDGTDIAPGLAATLKTALIVATFNSNNTYTVVATDSSNASVTFTGTWTATGNAGEIREITLNQSTPSALTSQGIFQVTGGNRLTYEVIQVQPPIAGFTAPTVAEGFGSTKYQNVALGATWIQKFDKQ
jgi:hypothetical protein